MRQFIFATHNAHKVTEIHTLLGGLYEITSLAEAGITGDIPEPYPTLEANARAKSSAVYTLTGKDCFSEDTGLEVAALEGAPGVRSARYAGEQKSAGDNIALLLQNLHDVPNREARFRTVFSLIMDGIEHQFEGVCPGRITLAPSGEGGFGYDPVFIPRGAGKTFAEMTLAEKNRYSHRARAVEKLIGFLKEQ